MSAAAVERRDDGVVEATEDMGLYWVQYREAPDEAWSDPGLPAAGWVGAVRQLRDGLRAALDGVDGEPDDVAQGCWRLADSIDRGGLAQRPYDGVYTGRFWRILPVGGGPRELMAERLRWVLVRDHRGVATVEVTTCTGARLRGQVSWDMVEAEVIWLCAEARTVALRATQVESFALHRPAA